MSNLLQICFDPPLGLEKERCPHDNFLYIREAPSPRRSKKHLGCGKVYRSEYEQFFVAARLLSTMSASNSADPFVNSANLSADSMALVSPAPNCSVCVDKHLASQHCATCDDVMCEAAVGVHSELVKCWAAHKHVMVRVGDMDPNMSVATKAVLRVCTKIDARLEKLQTYRQELLGREAKACQKLWTVPAIHQTTQRPPLFFKKKFVMVSII
jgi:hypothetical protein